MMRVGSYARPVQEAVSEPHGVTGFEVLIYAPVERIGVVGADRIQNSVGSAGSRRREVRRIAVAFQKGLNTGVNHVRGDDMPISQQLPGIVSGVPV